MSARQTHPSEPAPAPASRPKPPATTAAPAHPPALDHATVVTADGASWLASASTHPRSTLALWESHPQAPLVLPCGSAFDVVSVDAVFGRRILDRLWEEGPGSGPVAAHRGRMLIFAAPGTAHRLPSLLAWEEWSPAVPAPLCHGAGDAVTVPPLVAPDEDVPAERLGSRWLVAPDTRDPWLPGPEALLWASVRVARAMAGAAVRVSIFPPADRDVKVYDVSRRR
ncbi:bifunctional DNA primase/polymerase [Streptomyces cavernicola]|uniref:Bifunctional DNA primase/polymerase n=1 Tax=Streptomyces cavernicola TaxID=3043613 RepID=A0ABT6S8D3_9ACTN|nr:bifunctional DNA primase/polymerase [Streptomyces sp. B-S-A6]MDI3404367.1 bifunctional DNA primase/polymerase [Streptomyces sp. B-S-A6]